MKYYYRIAGIPARGFGAACGYWIWYAVATTLSQLFMNYSKFIAGITLPAMLLAQAGTAFAGFNDTAGNDYEAAINYVQEARIVSGYPDGSYQPYKYINRAEFTKIIMGAIIDKELIDMCMFEGGGFSDVPGDAWFTPYVCTAKEMGVIDGYPDGTFGPEKTINFAEAAKILVEAFMLGELPNGDEWWAPYVNALMDIGAVPPTLHGPDQELTRGEMAELIYRIEGVAAAVEEELAQ